PPRPTDDRVAGGLPREAAPRRDAAWPGRECEYCGNSVLQLADLPPIQQHFAAVSRPHRVKTFFVIAIRKLVRDQRRNIQPAFEHHGHLVPGLVHLASVNTLYGKHAENYLVPVDGHFFRRNAEHGDLRTVTHVVEHLAKGR